MKLALLQIMSHKITIDLNMFGVLVKCIIVGNLNGTLIVTIDRQCRMLSS